MKALFFPRLFFVFFLIACSSAFADNASQSVNVDISSLTPEQQQAVRAVANQMQEKRSDAPAIMQALQGLQSVDKDKVKGWSEAGTEAGKAVNNFSKEIGAVATDFLNSFIGKATFVLVFMNYGGGKLLQFGMNVLWFVVLTPFFLFFMYRVFQRFVMEVTTTKEVKYNQNILLRLLGVNDKTVKVEKMPGLKDDGSDLLPVIGWILIFVCNFVYFGLLWPEW